ncbi:acid phosphatase [Trichinella spiralis]|uniref:acid phosphatase n=1 Tax=Trichinella spiralis TaxID=6334 RepID=UPI0001EFBB98|nr:acid phosphatase [Trichinella spiralis]
MTKCKCAVRTSVYLQVKFALTLAVNNHQCSTSAEQKNEAKHDDGHVHYLFAHARTTSLHASGCPFIGNNRGGLPRMNDPEANRKMKGAEENFPIGTNHASLAFHKFSYPNKSNDNHHY